MFRKESKSYRKKKFKLHLFVTLSKYKASVNQTDKILSAKACNLCTKQFRDEPEKKTAFSIYNNSNK